MKKKTILPYNPNLKAIARQLRNNGTLSEALLVGGISKASRWVAMTLTGKKS